MKESLVCTQCGQTWKRERSRGRKPLLCPSCSPKESVIVKPKGKVKPRKAQPIEVEQIVSTPKGKTSEDTKSKVSIHNVFSSLYPKPKDAEDLINSTKNGSQWRCPSCGHILTLHVSISDVPTHRCTPDSVSIKICERIK